MAYLCSQHEVDVVYTVKLLHQFSHCFPCPLTVMVFGSFMHTTIRQETLLYTIGRHIFGKQFFFAHSKGVFVSILAKRVRIFLQTKLRGKFQIIGNAQFGIKDGHHRTIATLGVSIGTLFKDIKVER